MVSLLTLIRALVVSKVDYCNSVLAGAPGHLLDRLQSVLNAAARLIFAARKREHTTPLFHELHWLRVPERIKIPVMCSVFTEQRHHTSPAQLTKHKHSANKEHVFSSSLFQNSLSGGKRIVKIGEEKI